MARTPAEEARYQQLGTQLGFFGAPAPQDPDYGTAGFAGRTLANVLPGALEHIIQPAQALLGMDERSQIPNFFDVRAPKSITESVIGGAGQLASYLPSIALTEGAGAGILGELGVSARAAKIAGGGLGFAFPSAPEGPESAALQGGVGALQTAAQGWGWRGKLAAGVLGAGAGYYEGSKTDTQTGLVQGALNLIGPTLIDPAINKILGHNAQASQMGKAAETTAPPANQPRGPIPFAVSPDGPKDIAGLQIGAPPVPAGAPTLPFYNVPEPSGLRVEPPNGLTNIGGGQPIVGQPSRAPLRMPNEMPGLNLDMMGTGANFAYGRGVDPYDAFAGLQKPPIISHEDLFPARNSIQGRLYADENVTGVLGKGADFTYGRGTDPYNAFSQVERAPSQAALSPLESAARAKFETERQPVAPSVQSSTPVSSGKKFKEPYEKIPTGLQKLLGEDVGWTPPDQSLKEGFTRDAYNLGKKLATQKDVDRASKAASEYAKASEQARVAGDLEKAKGYAERKQYFDEAVEYATGNPPKAATFRRHDPNYSPNVPHPAWTEMIKNKLDAPVPVKGDDPVTWSEDGFPNQTTVTDVKDNVVHYVEHSLRTGQATEKVASLQEFDMLQKHPSDRPVKEVQQDQGLESPPPNPLKPGESPAPQSAASDRVKVKGKYGWEEAKIVGREGKTLHVEIEDPIFGSRKTSVLESDTQPVASLQKEIPKGGVPFKDVESLRLKGNEGVRGVAQRGESEADLLGSVYEGHSFKPAKGEKGTISLEEGLKKLPPEAATIIGSIFDRIKKATGQHIDLSLAQVMQGAKGGMYEMSGRVALNLQWIDSVVRNWSKMSDAARSNSLMRVAALFGHEVTHVAQKFGEKSGLMINGKPLLEAIKENVAGLSEGQRMYIAEQLKGAKGELSGNVSKYLAGDIDAVYNAYKKRRPNLTREQAVDLAAGEFMAEVGSVELIKRMEVQGLPTGFRAAIDRFKQVLINVVKWFAGNGHDSGVAALQNLSDIASKMYDHFGAATEKDLGHAFPASGDWKAPTPNPFSSGLPPTQPPSPPVVANNSIFLKSEIARLGLRATVGGVAGGLFAPEIAGNQTTVAEGVLLGGIAGLFGPAIVKRLLSGNFPQEIKEAITASKGNPIKTMAAILGNKSLRDMGLEARYGWTGEAKTMSKFVRLVEREFNLNLDPKMKALVEEGRGMGTMVLATVQDAMDKIRWYKPNASVEAAVEQCFTGKMAKDEFMKLMDSPELQTYGQSMVAAREGMTTLTQMFASGMPKSNFRDQLIATSDKYLGRFYSAYKEGKFNMEHFDAAKKDLMAKYHDINEQMADDILREHMREVQANRSLFGGRRGNSGQKIDTGLMSRRLATEEEIEGQKVVVGALEHDPYSADYLKEKAKLDWMESHKITDSWRDWLGEYKNPTERMIYTFQKVHPSAISAKIFSMLDERVNSNGLRFSYTPTGLAQARELISSELSKATKPEEVARLQNQLKELSGYGALPQGSAYGTLSGKWVDRFTRDEVNTYATPFKWMEQPILRGISSFNNAVKISRTALNPLTTIRNYIQLPMFALISKTAPGDIAEAFNVIHRLKNDDYRLMLERHIVGADYVAAELSKGPGHLLSGHLDSDIAIKLAKYGMDKALKFYQQPDMLLRAGTFISARRRFAQRAMEEGKFATLQEAMAHTDTIDKAQEYTNRYTMNYSAVPRIVKIGRQLPFLNLFVSYTSEITRILKNLTMDAISPTADSAGRMHAITVLGAMAAIPAMLTATFEGNLSEKDQKDWEKVKKLSPDYARGRFRLPTGRDSEGRFHYMDITNLLPADSYSQMIKAFASGDTDAAMAANPLISLQNTPLLNMAAEQIAGQDLQTGRKIEGIGRVREILKETLPPILPPGYEGSRLINAFSSNDQGGQGLTNLKTGVQYRPSDVIANYLTGMRFGNVQLATVQKSAIGQAKQELSMQQALLRDVVNTNVSADQKQRAVDIYKKAEEQIMLQLHSRLGQ